MADHDCLLVNSGPLASSLVPSVRIVPLHIFSCVVKRRERTKTETNRVLVSTVGSLLSFLLMTYATLGMTTSDTFPWRKRYV